MAVAVLVAAVVIGSGVDLAISLAWLANNSSASTSCTIAVDGELLLKVVNSSDGQPVASLPVQVEGYYPNCIPPSFSTIATNSTGMLLFGGTAEDYSLTVDFRGQNFTADTYIGPMTLTCVTLAITSGNLVIAHSQGGESDCETNNSTASTITETTTVNLTTSISTTSCTYTGPEVVACPTVYNESYVYSISYGGSWNASYRVYDGPGSTGIPTYAGSLHGRGPASVTVDFVLYSTGYDVCFSAEKLDASSSSLVLSVAPDGITNSTSIPFGTASLCIVAIQY